MREILFRGKRKDNDEWVEGYLYKKYYQELPHDRFVIQYKTTGNEYKWTPEYMSAEIDPETVGQYTGLTDKNGNKIFEGDIVNCFLSDIVGNPKISKILVEDMFDYNTMVYLNISDELEVIGNIHDNPELLGGADNG